MIPTMLDVLAPEECGPIVEKVHALSAHWSQPYGAARFHVLGASAYLDGQHKGAFAYRMLARKLGPAMLEAFGPLYDRVLAALVAHLGEPMELHPRLAVPGFHVFLADPTFELSVCDIHVDRPYDHVDWPVYEQVDKTRNLSFTLSLQLPRSGGGLYVWPQIPIEDALRGDPPVTELVRGQTPVLHRYAPGKMVVHHGHSIHQIAPFTVTDPSEARITLQGHAIRSARGWLAYF